MDIFSKYKVEFNFLPIVIGLLLIDFIRISLFFIFFRTIKGGEILFNSIKDSISLPLFRAVRILNAGL